MAVFALKVVGAVLRGWRGIMTELWSWWSSFQRTLRDEPTPVPEAEPLRIVHKIIQSRGHCIIHSGFLRSGFLRSLTFWMPSW